MSNDANRKNNYFRMQYGQGGRQHSGEPYGGADLSGEGERAPELEKYGLEPGYDGPYGRYDRYSRKPSRTTVSPEENKGQK